MATYELNCKCGRKPWKIDHKPKEHEQVPCPSCGEQYNSYCPIKKNEPAIVSKVVKKDVDMVPPKNSFEARPGKIKNRRRKKTGRSKK